MSFQEFHQQQKTRRKKGQAVWKHWNIHIETYHHIICGLAAILMIPDKKSSCNRILIQITIAVLYRRANRIWQALTWVFSVISHEKCIHEVNTTFQVHFQHTIKNTHIRVLTTPLFQNINANHLFFHIIYFFQ